MFNKNIKDPLHFQYFNLRFDLQSKRLARVVSYVTVYCSKGIAGITCLYT